MQYVEAEGNSIDEAIERALAQLGVPRERAEIEILTNTARGFLGLGGRKAKVRATLRSGLSLSPEGAAEPETAAPAVPASQEGPAPEAGELASVGAILAEIVRRMGFEARVETAADGRLVICGDSSGIVIGRRGQTLDALEYVMNRIASRGDEQGGRIVVDSEDYRERRRQSLEAMARRLAESARRRGKPVTLSPMSPRDRRIVHLALQGDPSLTTRSTGEGYFRRLVIVPSGSGGDRRGTNRRGGTANSSTHRQSS